MRKIITDPISLRDVTNLDEAPFVIEGTENELMKIYFESAKTMLKYLSIMAAETDTDAVNCYNAASDNKIMSTIN
jgi:hypothetical protein